MSRPRILVVGSTMMDLVTYVGAMPEEGQTLRGEAFDLGFGGKGANQAVAAAILGADVVFLNRVGDDTFGAATRTHLADAGIDTAHVHPTPGAATGVATILVEPSGENRIVIVPGANITLTAEDVDAVFDATAPPDIVLCQLEIEQSIVSRAFAHGRRLGATTILNPAPASAVDSAIPPQVDWVIPNESELAELVGVGDRVAGSASRLAAAWGSGVVATVGRQGAHVVEADAPDTTIDVPGVPVEAVDTTGAGDAFVGAFAVALAHGCSSREAAALACRWAADSVTRRGTQKAFLASALGPELRDLMTR